MSKIHIVQYEDRINYTRLNRFMNFVKYYSFKHEYTYHLMNKFNHEICPYYAKIFFVKDYLNSHLDSCDYLLFLDSDCIVLDNERKLESIIEQYKLNKEFHFLCTGNIKKVNTGHFLIRNSSEGRDLLNYWTNLYEPERWTLARNKKFICKTPLNVKCQWSGRYYEQGDFISFVIPFFRHIICFDPDTYPDIFWSCDTNSDYINNNYRLHKRIPFVIHLCNYMKTYTTAYKYLHKMGLDPKIIKSFYY